MVSDEANPNMHPSQCVPLASYVYPSRMRAYSVNEESRIHEALGIFQIMITCKYELYPTDNPYRTLVSLVLNANKMLTSS